MFTTMRVPWSQRQNPEQIEKFWQFTDELPVGLVSTLVEYVLQVFYVADGYGPAILNRDLANRFARIHNRYLDERFDRTLKLLSTDSILLLDAFDFSLGLLSDEYSQDVRTTVQLNSHLKEARFSFQVASDGRGSFELQRRMTDEFNLLVSNVTSIDDRASEHLRRALSCVYGKNPDPNTACVESVKAIEVVATPIVAPRTDSMRLGLMIKQIEEKPGKWATALNQDGDVQVIVSLLRWILLSHYRHGDPNQPIEPTQEAAEMVVQLAVLLTDWFRARRFSLRVD